jgi:hypothetical protein
VTRGLFRGLWWRSRGLLSAQYRTFCLFTPEAPPKCPLWRGYRIVVFEERLDNETAMFPGPTDGVCWQLDVSPEPLPPPAPPYPHHSLTSDLEKCGSPFCHTLYQGLYATWGLAVRSTAFATSIMATYWWRRSKVAPRGALQSNTATSSRNEETAGRHLTVGWAVIRALSMTVDCLRCRYCDGRQGDVQRWGLLRFGVLRRGGEFIYSLGQIGKVRAEVFQVYRCYYLQYMQCRVSQLHRRKL